MKVKASTDKDEFRPIHLHIKLETYDEAKRFYTIFNTPCVADFLDEKAPVEYAHNKSNIIRKSIEKLISNPFDFLEECSSRGDTYKSFLKYIKKHNKYI